MSSIDEFNKKLMNQEGDLINYNTIKNRFKQHKLDEKYNPIIMEVIEWNKKTNNKVNGLFNFNKLSIQIKKDG